MKKIDFVFFDAGGGHRSAATAVLHLMQHQQRPWQVRLVNLQELLAPIDLLRRLTGRTFEDAYNLILKKGWTLGTALGIRILHGTIRLLQTDQIRLLENHWRQSRPDLVVSFISHFNRIIFASLQRADPSVPLVTVMTDLADYPPHFWLERQEQFFVCGTARTVEQARGLGLREDQVFRTSGMILHPRFYERVGVDRAKERQRLGLDPQLPTGLVMFGGQGSSEMRQIARSLDGSRLGFQLIFICGRNQKLAAALRGQPARHPRFIEEFTTEVPYYMYLSDFFIGKPGPGSISEALAMKLPVIVERNAWTMPHERFNADWVEEMQVGLVVRSFRRIELAVERLFEPQTLVRYRANAAALNNRAVFEIPGILERILNRASSGHDLMVSGA